MLKRIVTSAVLIMAMLGVHAAHRCEASGKSYRAVSTEGDFGGMTQETFRERISALFDAVGKKLDVKFKFEVLSDAEALKQFKEGKVDIFFSGITFEMALDYGIDPRPLAVLASKGDISQRACLYVPPQSKIKSVADLKGQAIHGNLRWGSAYHLLRHMVHDAGQNAPLKDFFAEIRPFTDTKSAFEAAAADDGKAVYLLDTFKLFYRNDKLIADFKELACSPAFTQSLIMGRRDLDPEFRTNMGAVIANAHRDPDFVSFRFIFLAIDGAMVLVDDDDYEPNLEVYNTAVEKGWIKEARAYEAEFLE